VREKHRNILIPRNFPASLFILLNEKPAHKDKPLLMDLFSRLILFVFVVSAPFAHF